MLVDKGVMTGIASPYSLIYYGLAYMHWDGRRRAVTQDNQSGHCFQNKCTVVAMGNCSLLLPISCDKPLVYSMMCK